MRYDFPKLKANADILDIIGSKIKLVKKGSEYVGCCPWHDDKSPSLTVNRAKQVFMCPVCSDKKGDAVDFLTAYGYTLAEAAEELHGGPLDKPAPVRSGIPKRDNKKVVKWSQVIPGAEAPAPDFVHYKFGKPVKTWAYRGTDGETTGYVCRFETENGKEVLPYIYAVNEKRSAFQWKFQAFDKPRSLFNLDDVSRCKVAIVVEGEKTADHVSAALKSLIDKGTHAVTCWQGGTNAVQLADLSPLDGKTVILWPDNDAVGIKAMRAIAEQMSGRATQINYIYNPPEHPKGWDAADVEWDEDGLRRFIREHMHPEAWPVEPPPPEPEPEKPFELEIVETPPPDTPPRLKSDKPDPTNNPYFRVLGFETDDNGPVFVFFNKRLNCITRATAAGLTDTFFGLLAPPLFWAMTLGEECKKAQMVQWVIEMCGSRRMFDEAHIRGRGAWFDEGRAVLHCGDKLFVDGEPVSLGDFRTKFIYEVGHAMDFDPCEPLPPPESGKLLNAIRRLGWERAVNADLLAGWCMIAPICGALDWRPHIWVTGPAGTGKSWILENLVSRILGNIALRVQGETTEAGVRQSLGHDARPVLYDESEGEDRRAQDRLQAILTLMRGASTSDGGLTVKGSAGGSAKTFQIRSAFAFASINVPVSQQSDRSRITMLSLREDKAMKGEDFDAFKLRCVETFTDEYMNALRARTIRMIPVIKRNAKTFAKACAAVLSSQRSGDQAGALLAGAYALESDNEITYEAALARVQGHDWTEERGLDTTRDEVRLLACIMDHNVRLDAGVERTIGELIMIAKEFQNDLSITSTNAEDKLRRLGIRTEDDCFIVSNSSLEIKKILKDTAWSKEHHRILARIQGAKPVNSIRFAASVSRAVSLPVETMKPEGWVKPVPSAGKYPF